RQIAKRAIVDRRVRRRVVLGRVGLGAGGVTLEVGDELHVAGAVAQQLRELKRADIGEGPRVAGAGVGVAGVALEVFDRELANFGRTFAARPSRKISDGDAGTRGAAALSAAGTATTTAAAGADAASG